MRVFAVLALLATTASAQPSATLRATLDLTHAIEAGWLNVEQETVGLRGSLAPLSWDVTMEAEDPDGDGLYGLAVPFGGIADSAVVELKIKVDGVQNPNGGWQEGANHTVVLRAGETTDLTLAWSDRAPEAPPLLTGHIDHIPSVSAEDLAPRDVWVWLPPGYDAERARRYPVLYLHDGAGMFGVHGGSEWGMDETAQALVEAGEIEPLILVAVDNTDRRADEYTPTPRTWERTAQRVLPPTDEGELGPLTGAFLADGDTLRIAVGPDGTLVSQPPGMDLWAPLVRQPDGGYLFLGSDVTFTFPEPQNGAVPHLVATRPPAGGLGDAYGRLLTDTVKPMIDARYRTRADAAHTGLGGSSLGGLITLHLGLTRPDVFGRLLVASPSVWWDDQWILGAVERAQARPEQRIWVDIGLEEGSTMVPDARALHAALLARGWDPERVTYVEAEGAGHTTDTWAARAPDMLRFLFPAHE